MIAAPADCRKIIQIAATLAAAILAASAIRSPAQAAQTMQSTHMLVVPASDGYGFDDCLGANKPCGRVIADAWCEAHGMAASLSYGRAEDVTASVPQAAGATASPKLPPGSFIVNCRD